jgi:hypothetical protein
MPRILRWCCDVTKAANFGIVKNFLLWKLPALEKLPASARARARAAKQFWRWHRERLWLPFFVFYSLEPSSALEEEC